MANNNLRTHDRWPEDKVLSSPVFQQQLKDAKKTFDQILAAKGKGVSPTPQKKDIPQRLRDAFSCLVTSPPTEVYYGLITRKLMARQTNSPEFRAFAESLVSSTSEACKICNSITDNTLPKNTREEIGEAEVPRHIGIKARLSCAYLCLTA